MIGAGIHSGDLLVVDRSLEPKNGNVIVAALDGDLIAASGGALGWAHRACRGGWRFVAGGAPVRPALCGNDPHHRHGGSVGGAGRGGRLGDRGGELPRRRLCSHREAAVDLARRHGPFLHGKQRLSGFGVTSLLRWVCSGRVPVRLALEQALQHLRSAVVFDSLDASGQAGHIMLGDKRFRPVQAQLWEPARRIEMIEAGLARGEGGFGSTGKH